MALTGIYTGGTAVDIDSYELQWDGGVVDDWADLPSSAASERSSTKTGLSGGTDYSFRIRAANEYGSATAYSEPITIKTA